MNTNDESFKQGVFLGSILEAQLRGDKLSNENLTLLVEKMPYILGFMSASNLRALASFYQNQLASAYISLKNRDDEKAPVSP